MFRPIAALLGAFIIVPAFAFDATRAPRYSSPDLYRPNVDRVIIHGPGSTGPIDGMSVTPLGGTPRSLSDLIKGRAANWTDFGPGGACLGNAAADTATFQAAVAAGGRLTFRCWTGSAIYLNDGAVATKWINIDADNYGAQIKLTAAFPQTSDVLTIRPAPVGGADKFYGWRIAGVKIDPQVNGRGRHGFVFDLSAGGVQMTGLDFERNQVGDVSYTADGFMAMGAAAFRFIGHPTQADQFYVSTIKQNYLVGGTGFTDAQGNVAPGGGIYGRRMGDSVHIDENWIKGPGRAIDIEFITGAANPTFQRNNITASGGSIRVRYGFRMAIEDNQIELLTKWTGDADQALIVLNDCDGTVIDKNNVNADLGDHSTLFTADAISLLGNTARTDIRSGNRLVANSAAGRVHLRTASTVTATTFWPGQRIENPFLTVSNRQADVLATSIGTPGSVRGMWFSVPLLNSWAGQSTGGATYEGLFARVAPDGKVSLRGNLNPGTLTANTQIATLFADARPPAGKLLRLFPKQAQSGSGYLPIGVQLFAGGALTLTYALPNALPISFDDVQYDPTAN